MRAALLCILFSTGIFAPALAQRHIQDPYREAGNPLYWANRKPDAAYWQQDVHYQIIAKMDEQDNRIDGGESLVYWNNSPDTLTCLYFHLYQNAFIKGSYLHRLERAQGVKARLGKHEAAGQGTLVDNILVNGFTPLKTEIDNTVMKIWLRTPIEPGTSAEINIKFQTWYDNGTTRRRMAMYDAWGFKHYNGCQWYPKICVYDRKFGWDTYQHLNKEFYGDFGVFDVSLDFPSNYILEATGALQNRSVVLPDSLRAALDVKNFAHKKWNEAPSTIIPYKKGERKIWNYHAENVHDFAFTADPSYRIATAYWNGIECVGIVQEPHASGWQNSADYVAKIIRTFSETIGMYGYPKMVAADANDGMEYPMLTLDGSFDPAYHGLLVHELGHNWFYGMAGSNETYRALMDEGFTQFLTAWGLRIIDGENMITSKPKSKLRQRFTEPVNTLDRNVLTAYTFDALNKNELPINTHSNDFHNGLGQEGGYREVYYKTASMLYNLQYTLGDSLFLHAMQHYFSQWKFAHPYPEDFRASIIQYTHVDLNWFFDQWLETTKTIDYAICDVHKVHGADSFAIDFHRRGLMQMPIDFTVTAKNGATYSYHIPNTWFIKNTSATVLPKWYGWSKIDADYTARVAVPSGIRRVQIDTTFRLADVDYKDNYYRTGFFADNGNKKVHFDAGIATIPDRRHDVEYIRPDVWWNPIDGIKIGMHTEGSYLNTLRKFDVTVWYNTHVLQENPYLTFKSESYYHRYKPVNFSANLNSPLSKRFPKLTTDLHARYLDGLALGQIGLNYTPDERNNLQLFAKAMQRKSIYDFDYLIDPREWSSDSNRANSTLNLAYDFRYHYPGGAGIVHLTLRTPLLGGNRSDAFNYSYAQLEAVNAWKLGKMDVRTRLFGRYGTGSVIPSESALFLAGQSPEELMENKYTRTNGFIPDDWRGTSPYDVNHFQMGGGLNLRGYAGYFAGDERNGETLTTYKGRSGASASIELDVENYFNLHPKATKSWLHLDAYLFADAGLIELSRYVLPQYYNTIPTTMWSDVRVDAGPGFAATIKSWGVFDKARPLTLRIDFPVFVSRTPYATPQYIAWRYVIGINRSF